MSPKQVVISRTTPDVVMGTSSLSATLSAVNAQPEIPSEEEPSEGSEEMKYTENEWAAHLDVVGSQQERATGRVEER